MDHSEQIKLFKKYSGWSFTWQFDCIMNEPHDFIPPSSSKTELLTVGDSRWAGFPSGGLSIGMPVINAALSGSKICEWGSKPVIQSLVSEGATHFLIAAGGNDLGSNESMQKIMGRLIKICYGLQDYSQSKIIVHGVLPVIKHGKATNNEVLELNSLMAKACVINGWKFIDLFTEFYNPLSGWLKIEYVNLSEGVPVPKELLDLAEIGVKKAKDLILSKFWNKVAPVHFSSSGNSYWLQRLNSIIPSLL